MDPLSPKPPEESDGGHRRRPRYKGKNPRRFEDKYKEHDPLRYPELIERVRGRGATPAGQHIPILAEEILAVLDPKPGERGVDATLGYGGHAARFLARLSPGGQLLALDCDSIELPKTEARLRHAGHGESEFLVRRTNFASLARTLGEVGWHDGVDFLLADLGLSSMQIDDPARGFTFKQAGPLDMRMNRRRGLSAAQLLAHVSEPDLATLLERNADEIRAPLLARELCARRGTLSSTVDLARAVRDALAGTCTEPEADQSVRRVFQALRIEVNDEFGALERLLEQVPDCLRSRGRVALLSFHSGEDRRIKQAFQRHLSQGRLGVVGEAVIRVSAMERRSNPRSASAKLRWAARS